MPADRQKLIHSGKVLKDSSLLSETNITEDQFLVCMVTNAKAAPKKKETPVAPAAAAPSVSAAAPSVSSGAPSTPAQPITTTTPAAPQAAPQTAAATPSPAPAALNPAAVQQLTDMGFPQEEAEAALRAAQGNSDLAVEYLMSGIPDHARANLSAGGGAASPGTPLVSEGGAAGGGNSDLEMLRRHPQINELRRLVQANPASLSQVLEAIGQQNPELLRLIHANQADFLAMMNEPITEAPPAQAPAGGMPGMGGMPAAGGDMPNPVQMLQMLQMLPPDQREAAAQSLGMTSEQLQSFSQMVASLPPDQLQRLMGDAARAQAGGAGGGVPPGANVVRLTDEEMQAVNRLTELGFDQQDAVAAYLACDKNEALAANLLLEGWSADDGGA